MNTVATALLLFMDPSKVLIAHNQIAISPRSRIPPIYGPVGQLG